VEIEEALALVLKKYRKQLNISQEELANRSNLDRTFISLIERSKRKTTLRTLFEISKNLNMKTSKLIEEVENTMLLL
jgi:transcriptional regulator with XRE-family HTH domain